MGSIFAALIDQKNTTVLTLFASSGCQSVKENRVKNQNQSTN